MKRPLIFLVFVFPFFACASGRKSGAGTPASPGTSATSVAPADSIRDGSSFDRAIIIKDTDETAGVHSEYQWIRDNYPGYSTEKQSLVAHQGISFDVLVIRNQDRTEKTVYFNISRFYGKF